MEIIYVLVPLGLMLLVAAIWAFFWAVKNDQFDDLEGPAYSILFDDPEDQRNQLGEDTKADDTCANSDEECSSEETEKTGSATPSANSTSKE